MYVLVLTTDWLLLCHCYHGCYRLHWIIIVVVLEEMMRQVRGNETHKYLCSTIYIIPTYQYSYWVLHSPSLRWSSRRLLVLSPWLILDAKAFHYQVLTLNRIRSKVLTPNLQLRWFSDLLQDLCFRTSSYLRRCVFSRRSDSLAKIVHVYCNQVPVCDGWNISEHVCISFLFVQVISRDLVPKLIPHWQALQPWRSKSFLLYTRNATSAMSTCCSRM